LEENSAGDSLYVIRREKRRPIWPTPDRRWYRKICSPTFSPTRKRLPTTGTSVSRPN